MSNIKIFLLVFTWVSILFPGLLYGGSVYAEPGVLDSDSLFPDMNNGRDRIRTERMADSFYDDNGLERHSLEEIEALLHDSPEALIAVARMERSLNLLQQEQANSGWRLKAYANAKHYQELEDLNNTRRFNKLVVGGGLRYPLFGAYSKAKAVIIDSEAAVWEKRLAYKLAEMKALQTLRDHYIDYWSAAEHIRVGQAFLHNEELVKNFLEKRTITGHLLDADRQEFLTTFDVVRRNIAVQKSIMRRAIRGIRVLTEQGYPFFMAAFPELPEFCHDWGKYKADILSHHPQINIHRGLVESELGKIQAERHNALEGSFELGSYIGREDTGAETEYGFTMGIVVDLPVNWSTAQEASKAADLALLRERQLVLKKITTELLFHAENLFGDIGIAESQIIFSKRRLVAALESVRENTLRAEYLSGDTLEKLEQSRYRYYGAAIDYLDAVTRKLHIHAALLALSDRSPRQSIQENEETASATTSDSVINKEYLQPLWVGKKTVEQAVAAITERDQKSKDVSNMPSSGIGYYVWDSRKLFSQWEQGETFYQTLSAIHAARLLVSFDREQIRDIQQGKKAEMWRHFIEQTKKHDIAVELLLGEPLWILPRYRQDLLEIIQKLNAFPFSGLHLDLEPNQLAQKEYNEAYLLTQLLRTLQAVVEISPWPVAMSLHPRYLQPDNKICLGCALSNLDIDEVTLMSYIAEPERVNQVVAPIIEQYPDISFSIGQSVEPILTTEESYFSHGQDTFWQSMDRLQQFLSEKTSGRILIQSFQDFQAMLP